MNLELAARGEGALHDALAIGFDENVLQTRRPVQFGGLQGSAYFYLLLQEHLCLMEGLGDAKDRLPRYRNLMDILCNPHLAGRRSEDVDRARKLEAELLGRIKEVAPGYEYRRP